MLLTRWRCLLRGLLLRAYIHLCGGHAGRGLMADRGVTFRSIPHRGIHLGRDVSLGRGVIIDVPRTGTLVIGDGVLVGHYSVLAAAQELTIGDGAQIAERCSVRDSDHGLDTEAAPAAVLVRQRRGLRSEPVSIGAQAWIACNSAVLRGARIGDGAVVAAGSVVKGKVEPRTLVGGAPARLIRTIGEPA